MKNERLIRELILEYFAMVEFAHKSDLFNYISHKIDDFPDFKLVEKQLEELKSQKILKIQGESVSVISEIRETELEISELGPWNYQISALVQLPGNKRIKLDRIEDYIKKELRFLLKKNKALWISRPDLSLNGTKLVIEVNCDEWEGTATLYEDQIEIETIWKINDNLSTEWYSHIEEEKSKNIWKEIYLAMPAAGTALYLYFFIKSLINDIHRESSFQILRAEPIPSKIDSLKKKE